DVEPVERRGAVGEERGQLVAVLVEGRQQRVELAQERVDAVEQRRQVVGEQRAQRRQALDTCRDRLPQALEEALQVRSEALRGLAHGRRSRPAASRLGTPGGWAG